MAALSHSELDAAKFKDYLLPLLFLRRLSDVFDDMTTGCGSPRPFGPRDDVPVWRQAGIFKLVTEQVHPADMPEAVCVGLEHIASGRLKRSGGGRAAHVQSHKFAFRCNDVHDGKLRPYLDKAVLARRSEGSSRPRRW